MSTLRINNIEAQSIPASPTIDEKVKVTNSSGDILVNIDGKTSGITTIGINTTDGNIKFDANSNVLITGILTATTLAGNFTPDSLEVGSNIKLGNAGVITATNFKSGVTNVHNLGVTLTGGQLDVGSNIKLGTAGVVTATSFVGSGANLTGITQTTINSNTNNYLITGTGTANTLQGEAGLTFNGNILQVTDTTNGAQINLRGQSPKLYFDCTSGGTGSIFMDDHDLAFFKSVPGNPISERLRITSNGNISIGSVHGAKKVHISTTGNQKILIDPNYIDNSNGSSNTEANANNIVESILIRTSFGDNAGSQTNAGHKWGIKFQGYNGNDFTQSVSKCAGVFAVSEDAAGGYNRQVGLTFHTSPYNTAHREVMRINTNGIVTKPYQYVFTVSTSGISKSANWSKITGLTPVAAQCTNVSNGTNWSNSTQRFTAPVAGVYHFFVGGWANPNSNGSRYAYTFKHTNGNNYQFISGGDYCSADSPMAGWSRTIKLAANEWVELWGFSAISATWGGGHHFYWGGYLLG